MVKSFGKVTVGTPGVPVQATINAADPAKRVGVNSVMFEALPIGGKITGWTGKLYIGVTQQMDKSTLSGVVAVLSTELPVFSATLSYAPAGLDLTQFWIDSDQANDAVLVSCVA